MAESFDTVDTEQPSKGGRLAGMVSSGSGRLILGGLVVAVLAAAIGAILYFFVLSEGDDGAVIQVPKGGGSTIGTSTAGAPKAPVYRKVPDAEDVYRFRNIFAPTVNPPVAPSSDTSGSTDTSSTPRFPADTLALLSVSTVDSVPKATLYWNGQEHTLGAGEIIPGSPWELLSIDGSTVVMLYGDSRVPLTLGQAISTK